MKIHASSLKPDPCRTEESRFVGSTHTHKKLTQNHNSHITHVKMRMIKFIGE